MKYPTTRLLLVRHGETAANVAGRMQGRGDDPLTERGLRQTSAIAGRLLRENTPIAAIYCSPLLRARHTADAIAAQLGLAVRLRDGLQEFNLGALENVSAEELAAATPTDVDEPYPGGESAREFVERIAGTLYGIGAAHAGSTVVAVSHGGVIATALAYFATGTGYGWRDYISDNCALSIVEFVAGPGIVSVNDCTHLDKM